MPSTNIKIEPQLRDSITTSGTQLQSTVTPTNKLQLVPTTDQHCNFLGVPVMYTRLHYRYKTSGRGRDRELRPRTKGETTSPKTVTIESVRRNLLIFPHVPYVTNLGVYRDQNEGTAWFS